MATTFLFLKQSHWITLTHSSCLVSCCGRACWAYVEEPELWSGPQSCWASGNPDKALRTAGADFVSDRPECPTIKMMVSISFFFWIRNEWWIIWAINNFCRLKVQELMFESGQSFSYLYGYDKNVQGIWFLRSGQRLPLTLQFGYLHPLPIEKGIKAIHLPHCHKQHISMTILNGLIVDSAQIVSAQKILFGESQRNRKEFNPLMLCMVSTTKQLVIF